jgi:hypothetical protein
MREICGDAASFRQRARRRAGEWMRTIGTVSCLAALLVACSAPAPPETAEQERENALAKERDCADPDWQREHLGLWFDICRRNALR